MLRGHAKIFGGKLKKGQFRPQEGRLAAGADPAAAQGPGRGRTVGRSTRQPAAHRAERHRGSLITHFAALHSLVREGKQAPAVAVKVRVCSHRVSACTEGAQRWHMQQSGLKSRAHVHACPQDALASAGTPVRRTQTHPPQAARLAWPGLRPDPPASWHAGRRQKNRWPTVCPCSGGGPAAAAHPASPGPAAGGDSNRLKYAGVAGVDRCKKAGRFPLHSSPPSPGCMDLGGRAAPLQTTSTADSKSKPHSCWTCS